MKNFLKSVGVLLVLCAIGAVAGLVGARGYLGWHSPYIEGDYAQQRAQAGSQVILLGTTWCGYCAKTRAYLKSRGVAFADLDIEQSKLAEQLHEALGGEGVPVILIGDRQIRGYRPKVMDDAIAVLGMSAKPDPVL